MLELFPKDLSIKKLKHKVYVNGEKKLVSLAINVDGVKLQSTTNKSMWPILCRVNESLDQTPFVASIHIGSTNLYIYTFVGTMAQLLKYCNVRKICNSNEVISFYV